MKTGESSIKDALKKKLLASAMQSAKIMKVNHLAIFFFIHRIVPTSYTSCALNRALTSFFDIWQVTQVSAPR